LGNRSIGEPSYESLRNFFDENYLVLWGNPGLTDNTIGPLEWLLSLNLVKIVFGISCVVAQIFICFTNIVFSEKKYQKLYVAGIISLCAWDVLFFKHANGYTNPILDGVLFASTLLTAYFGGMRFVSDKEYMVGWSYKLSTAFICATLSFYSLARITVNSDATKSYVLPQELESLLKGKVVLTNMSAIFLQHDLPQTLVLGRCEPGVLDNFDTKEHCLNYFYSSKDGEFAADAGKPDYFVFARAPMSGNMRWSSDTNLALFQSILDTQLNEPKIFAVDHVDRGLDLNVYSLKKKFIE
jgi:hypothetical protein